MARIEPDLRDIYASQILNAYIISTSEKRITLIDRIKRMLGIGNYTINYDFNGRDMAKKAFKLADFMMKERDNNNEINKQFPVISYLSVNNSIYCNDDLLCTYMYDEKTMLFSCKHEHESYDSGVKILYGKYPGELCEQIERTINLHKIKKS